MAAIALVFLRPARLYRPLRRGLFVVGGAFIIDAAVTVQPLRLAGTVAALLCGIAVARLGPPSRRDPGAGRGLGPGAPPP